MRLGTYLQHEKLINSGLVWAASQHMKKTFDFFHIVRIFLLDDFSMNPQTRYALAFLPPNISAVGSVPF